MFSHLKKTPIALFLIVAILMTGCSTSTATDTSANGNEVKLILAGYTTPREAYRELIPIFQQKWKEQTGQTVTFEESYQGSGAQSRAVAEGFEADIVALSLEADVIRLEKAGRTHHDCRRNTSG